MKIDERVTDLEEQSEELKEKVDGWMSVPRNWEKICKEIEESIRYSLDKIDVKLKETTNPFQFIELKAQQRLLQNMLEDVLSKM